jgi:hypothetical protein
VHNHVRPVGFPDVVQGLAGFRVWTDVPKPRDYRIVACRCGWAPHLRQHFRVKIGSPDDHKESSKRAMRVYDRNRGKRAAAGLRISTMATGNA